MEHYMQPVDDKSIDKAVQALAHNICRTQHPEDQIWMTGWVSMEGQFLVSCAHCKMKVYNFYREETNG